MDFTEPYAAAARLSSAAASCACSGGVSAAGVGATGTTVGFGGSLTARSSPAAGGTRAGGVLSSVAVESAAGMRAGGGTTTTLPGALTADGCDGVSSARTMSATAMAAIAAIPNTKTGFIQTRRKCWCRCMWYLPRTVTFQGQKRHQ